MNNSTFGGVVASALASLMIASTTWWYIRLQVSGGWSSATGDPSTVLPALAIVFLGVAVPFFLNGSGKFTLSFARKSAVFLVVFVAFLVTLSTGLLLTGEFFTPAAVSWNTYGFPLTWRVEVMNGCPPWCNLPSTTTTTFIPISFAIDSAFYLAIGLAAVQIYKPLGRRILNP
ncbi:MAG TPA: hypothetical protein VFV92_11525, partial [Candidatus Bathyarchaeia archaeon]|nr:hypothetical protein [Candidatus Bathyarchaeia archaeon]